jgi:outer membrane receptor protein involved in Fe transport
MTARGKSPCFVSIFALSVAMASGTALADQGIAVPAAPAAVPNTTPVPNTAQAAPAAGVEDIVVTAQKRTEKLKDVPISISAISSNDLAEKQIKDYEDIARSVPGVSFNSLAGSEGLDNIVIRGVSSTSGSATVGLYIDDVSITVKNFFDGSPQPQLFDLDRVEVLRGPQGTLFGASSEGGTIRFVTKPPDLDDFSAEIGSELGGTVHGGLNYQDTGIINEPIVPGQSAVRASISYTDNSGYIDHFTDTGVNDANGINQDRDLSFRMTGKFLVGAGTVITPGIFYQRDNADDNGVFRPDIGLFDTNKPVDEFGHDTLFLPSLTVNQDLGFADLTSVTGYFYRYFLRQQDGTFFNSTVFAEDFLDPIQPQNTAQNDAIIANLRSPVRLSDRYDQISQEFRLASKPAGDGDLPLKWVAGIYYSDQHISETDFQQIPGINTVFQQLNGFSLNNLAPQLVGLPAGTSLFPDDIDEFDEKKYDERQGAVFGQLDYDILPDLHAGFGARYLEARDVLNFSSIGFFQIGNISPDNQLVHSYAFTPKFTLSYDIDPESTVYTSAAKGFRLGGPQPAPAPFGPQTACAGDFANIGVTSNPSKFASDKLWTYEVGSKNRLDDNQISLDVSGYYSTYDNIQQQIFLPTCGFFFTDNVGNGEIYGGEAEATYRPRWVPGLTLGLNASYTHAAVTQSSDLLTVQPGQRLLDVPYDTLSATVQYNYPITEDLNLATHVDYDFTGPSNGSFLRSQSSYYNPAYGVVNLSVGVVADRYEVTLFAKNLLNNDQIIQRPEINTIVEALTLRPLTVGLGVKYRFGS